MTRARRALIACYLAAAALGAVVPYAILIPDVRAHGIDLRGFVGDLFVNPAATVFSLDAIMASLVFLVLVVVEGRRADMTRLWLYPLLNLLFGLSCALPFFLAMRERVRRE